MDAIVTSKKKNKKISFGIAGIILAIIILGSVGMSVARYVRYYSCQNEFINQLDLLHPEDAKPERTRKVRIESWSRKLRYEIGEWGNLSYSKSVATALKSIGITPSADAMSYLLCYTSYKDWAIIDWYSLYGVFNNEITIAIGLVAIVVYAILVIVYKKHKNQVLTVYSDRIEYKNNKDEKVIPISRINSVTKATPSAVEINSNSTNITVTLLKNQVEIIDAISDLLNENK